VAWRVVMKAGTPPETVHKLQVAIAPAVASPGLRQGVQPTGPGFIGSGSARTQRLHVDD